MLQQGENGEQEHIHMPSSSSGHWATASASPTFNLQNILSVDSGYNRQISSQLPVPLTSRHVLNGKIYLSKSIISFFSCKISIFFPLLSRPCSYRAVSWPMLPELYSNCKVLK